MIHNDRDQVKEMLKDRIEDLCLKLLPDGKRQGRLWVSYNPVTGDHDRSSPELKVALTADRGAWKCWRSGDKGDVFGLIGYVRGLDEFSDIMRWARDWLGITHLSAEERKRLDREIRQRRLEADARAEEIRRWKIREAEKKFLSGMAYGAGSAAERHVAAYLAGRHCALADVPNLDETSFRFHPASEYWTLAEYRAEPATGRKTKVKPGPDFPALHSALRTATGQTLACHVTFLDPVRPRKAALGAHNAKLMFGPASGCVIRISHGPEGAPPELATERHPLVLCEGIETGLSLAIALPEARVWAAGSLSNMGNAPVGLDCISAVILARDNNEGNDQAEGQLAAVLEVLAKAQKPLTVMASHLGDDFNDLATGDEG